MRIFAIILSFFLWGFGVAFSDHEIRKIAISVPIKSVFIGCSKANPREDVVFFETYVDDGKHLFTFYARSPLPQQACDAFAHDAKKLLKNSRMVTLGGCNRSTGIGVKELDNDLLKKYGGKVYEDSFFSQISNGKSCQCWFVGCSCPPVPVPAP